MWQGRAGGEWESKAVGTFRRSTVRRREICCVICCIHLLAELVRWVAWPLTIPDRVPAAGVPPTGSLCLRLVTLHLHGRRRGSLAAQLRFLAPAWRPSASPDANPSEEERVVCGRKLAPCRFDSRSGCIDSRTFINNDIKGMASKFLASLNFRDGIPEEDGGNDLPANANLVRPASQKAQTAFWNSANDTLTA
jgi:hypothetical protein